MLLSMVKEYSIHYVGMLVIGYPIKPWWLLDAPFMMVIGYAIDQGGCWMLCSW
jgi:hypothetical protein